MIPAGLCSAAGSPVEQGIDSALESSREELVAIYRDLHAHPELSGQEERTAAIIAEFLRGNGFDVTTGVGGHGVVGVLEGKGPGPVVAYRADMDAVRSADPDVVPYASVYPGIRHICGHDLHVTVGLGIARAMSANRESFRGTVKLIFQPAEENTTGAKAMIDDGVLKHPAPEAIFAVHTAPLEVGQIGVVDGMILPGIDSVTVRISGNEDTVARAVATVRDVFLSTSTLPPPGAPAADTSDASNPDASNPDASSAAISEPAGAPSSLADLGVRDFIYSGIWEATDDPDSGGGVLVRAFVKASSETAYAVAKDRITRGLQSLSEFDVQYSVSYEDRTLPDTINDSALVASTRETLRRVVGVSNVIEVEEAVPYNGEDFSHFLQAIPGAMYWLGAANTEKGITGMPHSADFSIDEEAIIVGARTMTSVIFDYALGR